MNGIEARGENAPDLERLQHEALAEGYKDETCPKCGTEFKAYHHFIRCDSKPCPMISKDQRSFLEQFADAASGFKSGEV